MQKAALLKVVLAFASCAFAAGQVASPATSTLAPTQNASSSSGNVTSPTLNISGSYWTGSAPATDTWSIIDVLGTGSAPTSTLTFSHSAGAGVASLSAPMFQATGGSAGGISFSAGSVPLSFPSNSVTFYAPTPISPAFQVVLPRDEINVDGRLCQRRKLHFRAAICAVPRSYLGADDDGQHGPGVIVGNRNRS
jgi:hypothetical protein